MNGKMKRKALESFLLNPPSISVEPLYNILNSCSKSFKIFCILHTATKMRIFDHLSKKKTINDLCKNLEVDPDLIHSICKVLANLSLLKEENGFYKNTEISDAYLRAGSPLYQQHVLDDIRNYFELWEKLSEILKNGPITVSEEKFFENHINSLSSEALCGELQRTVKIIVELPEFGRARKLLDLGGGHGFYSMAFTKWNPNLKAYVFDFPKVIERTKEYIKKFDAERVEVIPGNFFTDDIGKGYDIVFFAYNPGGRNPSLVPKIHSSLNDGGVFINKHVFYHKGEDSKDPLLDIEWSLMVWEGVKKRKRIYSFEGDLTFEEYIELLEKYFSIVKIVDASHFAGYPLSKLGDTLDAKIIIAKKEKV